MVFTREEIVYVVNERFWQEKVARETQYLNNGSGNLPPFIAPNGFVWYIRLMFCCHARYSAFQWSLVFAFLTFKSIHNLWISDISKYLIFKNVYLLYLLNNSVLTYVFFLQFDQSCLFSLHFLNLFEGFWFCLISKKIIMSFRLGTVCFPCISILVYTNMFFTQMSYF